MCISHAANGALKCFEVSNVPLVSLCLIIVRMSTYPPTFVVYMVNYEWMCHEKASIPRLAAGLAG